MKIFSTTFHEDDLELVGQAPKCCGEYMAPINRQKPDGTWTTKGKFRCVVCDHETQIN